MAQKHKKRSSGRPRVLDNPIRRLFVLEEKHVKRLASIARREKLSGNSEALRFILDNYRFD